MTDKFESAGKTRLTPRIDLWTLWLNAFRIFGRNFTFLRDEIAAATWPRFFITIFTTLVLGSGIVTLVLGLSYKAVYEKTLRIPFNLLGYWLVETLWTVLSTAVVEIPFILLVAYLSYYWVSHSKDENTHWIQEAHTIAITWAVTALCVQAVYLLGGTVRETIFRGMNFATRAVQEHRYSPLLSFIFSGLLTAPIVAYRYNLLLHGNKILKHLIRRNHWLLLGFQFILLEGGTLLVSQLVLHLPIVISLHEALSKLWIL